MTRRAETALLTALLLTALLLTGPPVAAQTQPEQASPPGRSTPWNAGTDRPAPPDPASSDSTLSLRIYDGVTSMSPLPYRPRQADDPAYAVDVSAVMSRCDDGRLVITALLIGGHLTPLDNRCNHSADTAPGVKKQECDAKTWNCAPGPPE